MLRLGELALRGAAGMGEGGGCFWGGGGGGGLPLRGAARLREGGGCFGGELPLRGAARFEGRKRLLRLGETGDPAARGCSTERGRKLLYGELPLRGAARFEGRKRLLRLGELPLRGAAGMGEGGGSFWRSSRLPAGRRIPILAGTTGPSLKNTNSSKKPAKVSIYTNSSEIGESMSPLCVGPVVGLRIIVPLAAINTGFSSRSRTSYSSATGTSGHIPLVQTDPNQAR